MLRHLICDGVATVSARVPVPVIGLFKTQRAGTGVYITAGGRTFWRFISAWRLFRLHGTCSWISGLTHGETDLVRLW
jgi:hypothetical protein